MKNILFFTLLVLLSLSCGSTKDNVVETEPTTSEEDYAQQRENINERGMPQRSKRLSPDELVALLNLTEEQEEQFLAHLEGSQDQLKALRAQYADDRAGMREAMKEVRENREKGIKDILTAEQLVQYREIMKNNRRPRKGKN